MSASGVAETYVESEVEIDSEAGAGTDANEDPVPDDDEVAEEVEGALADGSVKTRRIRFMVVMVVSGSGFLSLVSL